MPVAVETQRYHLTRPVCNHRPLVRIGEVIWSKMTTAVRNEGREPTAIQRSLNVLLSCSTAPTLVAVSFENSEANTGPGHVSVAMPTDEAKLTAGRHGKHSHEGMG